LNVWQSEDGNTAYVEAELPGLSIDQVDVSVLGSELTISGERRIGEIRRDENIQSESQNGAAEKPNWVRRERGEGRFTRRITLPWDVDSEKVTAQLKDGVLFIALPRSEASLPRKVKLQSI
jgi:HSP20 family protein